MQGEKEEHKEVGVTLKENKLTNFRFSLAVIIENYEREG